MGYKPESYIGAPSTMLAQVKSIVENISNYCEEKAHPIVSNQNCKLATWSFEWQMRGMNILPRPVYNPYDILFSDEYSFDFLTNGSPKEHRTKDMAEFFDLIHQTLPKSGNRAYLHLSWGQGHSGGHETIAMNINDKLYGIDPQQGNVLTLNREIAGFSRRLGIYEYRWYRIDNLPLNRDAIELNDDRYIKPFSRADIEKFERDNNQEH